MMTAGVWFLLGVVIAVGGSRLQFGTWETPGPGFLPTLTGVALAGLAAAVVFTEWRAAARVGPKTTAPTTAPVFDRWAVWRLVGTIVALFAYALLLMPLGFVLTTLLVLGFLFRCIAGLGWVVSLGSTVAATVLSYVLFNVWLKVPFPPGLWRP